MPLIKNTTIMWANLKTLLLEYLPVKELKRYESFWSEETIPSIRLITIKTKEAVDIYTGRSRSPAALSGKVIGFIALLEALNKVEDGQLSISLVCVNNLQLVVFTDCNITKIFGALYFL